MPRRPRLRPTLITAGAFLAVSGGALALLGEVSTPAVVGSLLAGALLVGGFWLFRILVPHLGRLTTCAALALVGATALGGWAALAPTCPGDYAGRCDTAQIANWALSGAAFPISYLVMIGLPVLGSATAWRLSRKAAAWAKGRRHQPS